MTSSPLFPILEFDPARKAILEPQLVRTTRPAPPSAVLCFFQDVIESLTREKRLEMIGALHSEIGEHPIYVLREGGKEILVMHPQVGAPLCAMPFVKIQ